MFGLDCVNIMYMSSTGLLLEDLDRGYFKPYPNHIRAYHSQLI